jgi:hypothetical protein
VSGITSNSATFGGVISNASGNQIMERGVVYSTTPNPTIGSNKIVIGNGIGTFDTISALGYQYPHLLNYIKKGKSGYTMIKSKKEYKSNKTKESEYEDKLQYIARNVYSKPAMYKDVDNYLDTYEIKWYEIEENKKDVYALLVNQLKKKLEDLLR